MLSVQEPSRRSLLDVSRVPLQPTTLALPGEQAAALLEEHQARIRATATTLLERNALEDAIQYWRKDLLTKQESLKSILEPYLSTFLQHVPIFERARSAHLHLRHHDLNLWETVITFIKITVPPLLLLFSLWYGSPLAHTLFQDATQYSVGSTSSQSLAKEVQMLCPAGFIPRARVHPALKPTAQPPALSDYSCVEVRCERGFVLKGATCFPVNCTATADQIFDPTWGFCVPRERTVDGLLWGKSSCDAKLTWLSLLDIACWASYMRLFLPWAGTQLLHAASGTVRIVAAGATALLLLSFLRISWSAASQYAKKARAARQLANFLVEAERICLEKLEYRLYQLVVPRLFEHLDTLQSMPPVQRAVSVAEMGFSKSDEVAEGTTVSLLSPLYVKCIQDVLTHVNQRSLVTLVEADLVESKQFPTLIQWIEDSSKEFRDEVGRVRAQRALLSFQEDVRAAVSALSTARPQIPA